MAVGKRFSFADVLIYLFLFIFTAICVLPFWFIIAASVSGTGSGVVIQDFTLDAYRFIFSTPRLSRSLLFTIRLTIIGTFLQLFITSLMAYALSEVELPGRRLILNMVIFTMLFSGGMIPTFFVVRSTGLLDSMWALIIPTLVSPFNLIVMKNFFQNLPDELKESARLDGCHELIILLRIVMPLSVPVLATFGLFYSVALWNTYMGARLYISTPALFPIQVLLRTIVVSPAGIGDSVMMSQMQIHGNNIRMAVVVFATIPIVCVYPFLQKHFSKGIMVGSIKG